MTDTTTQPAQPQRLTSPADAMFAAARALGEQMAAQRAAYRQALKDDRSARRRARYAATPRTPKVKPAAVEVDADYEVEPECRCHIVPMPPCGWCEGGAEISEDES